MNDQNTATAVPLASNSRLLNLPEELINEVFVFLPWRELVACQLTCRSLWRISKESLIWRRHCINDYKYWQGEGYFESLLRAPPASINWKQLFTHRKKQDRAIDQDLESILDSQANRVSTIHHTVLTRYDAKDALLRHLDVADDAEDVLSRRYWASEILGSIERSEALEEWLKLAAGEDVPLERALGAFDLFVAAKPPLALDDISRQLQAIADRFKADEAYESFQSGLIGDKAGLLSHWLRRHNYTGLDDNRAFRDWGNLLIGVALAESDHPSLPLISVAIYCLVAKRLGLNASCCSYPNKVLAMVNVDESYPESSQGNEPLYLDPHEGIMEIPVSRLKNQLSAWGVPHHQHAEFLGPATTISLVRRIGKNIEASLQDRPDGSQVLTNPDPRATRLLGRTDISTWLEPARAAYALCWTALIFPDANHRTMLDLRIPLTRVASQIQQLHRQDIFLLHKLTPHLPELLDPKFVSDIADEILELDSAAPVVHHRSELPLDERNKVLYRVGHVLKHRRYGYFAVVTGWDSVCRATSDWISQMRVDELPQGRHQPFYHVLVASDESTRYVAQENIDIEAYVSEEIPEGLERTAGQYFKRWDAPNHYFISNVKDQYPED